jgi:hypothetical protein
MKRMLSPHSDELGPDRVAGAAGECISGHRSHGGDGI